MAVKFFSTLLSGPQRGTKFIQWSKEQHPPTQHGVSHRSNKTSVTCTTVRGTSPLTRDITNVGQTLISPGGWDM